MTRRAKTWLIAVGVFAAYLVVAALAVLVFHLHGKALWVTVILLALLGLASAATTLWLFRDQLGTSAPDSPIARLDATLAAARAKLASATRINKPTFGALPVVLVLGPDGSTKTTTIVRSGLEPELLAGAGSAANSLWKS